MMAEDRDLRLKGYEVYRFGGAELTDRQAADRMLNASFDRLHQRYLKWVWFFLKDLGELGF
ncbi:hypothetical protein E1287_17150 [Actinomadura sp. KC06]|uniref:hypothetical protein n=1 Tax=Actinomadura sp. KC06 TaxID=2530369 RepID=UPI001043BDAF|nr:hypothetical protein [Actinomadura sp. KC06]TDD34221.1 hypothetical protein E1287_17150 [Actinomadura sp. KC06]